ncbi:hypothetical protein ZWY2020_056777 [Hordeum vulgare]|nr:hypothetical protein ZWY2020_056777 [Hordeum vulgare]
MRKQPMSVSLRHQPPVSSCSSPSASGAVGCHDEGRTHPSIGRGPARGIPAGGAPTEAKRGSSRRRTRLGDSGA